MMTSSDSHVFDRLFVTCVEIPFLDDLDDASKATISAVTGDLQTQSTSLRAVAGHFDVIYSKVHPFLDQPESHLTFAPGRLPQAPRDDILPLLSRLRRNMGIYRGFQPAAESITAFSVKWVDCSDNVPILRKE
jgi:hypothetical protein